MDFLSIASTFRFGKGSFQQIPWEAACISGKLISKTACEHQQAYAGTHYGCGRAIWHEGEKQLSVATSSLLQAWKGRFFGLCRWYCRQFLRPGGGCVQARVHNAAIESGTPEPPSILKVKQYLRLCTWVCLLPSWLQDCPPWSLRIYAFWSKM